MVGGTCRRSSHWPTTSSNLSSIMDTADDPQPICIAPAKLPTTCGNHARAGRWEHWASAAFRRFVTSVTHGGTSAPGRASEGSPMPEHPDEIRLIIPGRPDFLRLARLAAADAGSRAGLTFDEIEDLRIAVDELCHSVMRADGTGVVELVFELGEEGLVVGGAGPP